jgi:hypothetical protein
MRFLTPYSFQIVKPQLKAEKEEPKQVISILSVLILLGFTFEDREGQDKIPMGRTKIDHASRCDASAERGKYS